MTCDQNYLTIRTVNLLVLKIVNILFWIVFVGLCIKTGALLISFFVSLFINPEGAKDLYRGLDLFDLYGYSRICYIQAVSLLVVLTGLKAYIAYLVVRLFMLFRLSEPFRNNLTDLFLKISYFSIVTGMLAIVANLHNKWVMKKGVSFSMDRGSEEILFFAGVIYILALVFRKGAELQAENDLTV